MLAFYNKWCTRAQGQPRSCGFFCNSIAWLPERLPSSLSNSHWCLSFEPWMPTPWTPLHLGPQRQTHRTVNLAARTHTQTHTVSFQQPKIELSSSPLCWTCHKEIRSTVPAGEGVGGLWVRWHHLRHMNLCWANRLGYMLDNIVFIFMDGSVTVCTNISGKLQLLKVVWLTATRPPGGRKVYVTCTTSASFLCRINVHFEKPNLSDSSQKNLQHLLPWFSSRM